MAVRVDESLDGIDWVQANLRVHQVGRSLTTLPDNRAASEAREGIRRQLRRSLECLVGVHFTEGNAITVLRNGDEIFPAMLEAIRKAQHTVDLMTFVYWKGRPAQQFADALCDRAKAAHGSTQPGPEASSDSVAKLCRTEGDSAVIREELSRLFTRGERHRRLFARLVLAFGLSTVVFAVGTVLVWIFESGQKGGNIHGFGDSAFFCAVQLLIVSSSMTNPVTSAGKIIDVGLEAWAIFVVTAVAGSFATFFSSGDTTS